MSEGPYFGDFLKTPKVADFYLSNHSNSLDLQSYFVFRKVGNSGAFGFPADVPVWRHRHRAVTWQHSVWGHMTYFLVVLKISWVF